MNIYKIIKPFLATFCLVVILNGCGGNFKPDWSKPAEPNAKKRAQQNVKDGKGIGIFGSSKNKTTNFMFASSNPMWRASLDTLDFISLANVDYSGGIIITDWYSEENTNEAIKITIRFLSNEIRADGIVVNLHKRTCKNNNCKVKEIKNDLIFDIKDKILRKAAVYKKDEDKNVKKNKIEKVYAE